MRLMFCKNCWLCSACWMTKVASACLSQSLGGLGAMLMALVSNSSMNRLVMMGLMGSPWLYHGPVHNTYHGRGGRYFSAKPPVM